MSIIERIGQTERQVELNRPLQAAFRAITLLSMGFDAEGAARRKRLGEIRYIPVAVAALAAQMPEVRCLDSRDLLQALLT